MDERKYLTEEELARFLKVIDSPRDRAIFTIMYYRGLRGSEVALLKMSSWRESAGTIYVQRLKGSRSGEYPLSPAENRALKAWMRVRGKNAGPLFPSRNGRGIGRDRLDELMKMYSQRAQLPVELRHCHALKHSIATHLVGKLDVVAVQDWLGHADIKSSMKYLVFRSKERDLAAQKFYADAD